MGCKYFTFECKAGEVEELLKQHPSYRQRPHLTKEDCNGDVPNWMVDRNRTVRGKMYDMSDFVDQSVDISCAMGKIDKDSLKPAETPFTDESNDPRDCVISVEKDSKTEDDSENRKQALEDLGKEIAASRENDPKRNEHQTDLTNEDVATFDERV